jgi:hypothetical protein
MLSGDNLHGLIDLTADDEPNVTPTKPIAQADLGAPVRPSRRCIGCKQLKVCRFWTGCTAWRFEGVGRTYLYINRHWCAGRVCDGDPAGGLKRSRCALVERHDGTVRSRVLHVT